MGVHDVVLLRGMAHPLYHLAPKPPYPARSRALGEEGIVVVAR